jgi:hypothetical protein
MSTEEETLSLLLHKALLKAQTEPKTREMALVITKVQEAMHWHADHLRVLQQTLRNSGFTGQAPSPTP